MDKVKKSTIVGGAMVTGTAANTVAVASQVVGASAAPIMHTVAGTVAAKTAAVLGASGLSGGAAISSGLATAGGLFGGGMATGAIVCTAGPLLIAAGAAYGLCKWLED